MGFVILYFVAGLGVILGHELARMVLKEKREEPLTWYEWIIAFFIWPALPLNYLWIVIKAVFKEQDHIINNSVSKVYEQALDDGREQAICEVICILNEIDDGGTQYRYHQRDLRHHLLARLGVPEDEWPLFIGDRQHRILSEEELSKCPQI